MVSYIIDKNRIYIITPYIQLSNEYIHKNQLKKTYYKKYVKENKMIVIYFNVLFIVRLDLRQKKQQKNKRKKKVIHLVLLFL